MACVGARACAVTFVRYTSIDLEQLGLEARLKDSAFLNRLQSGVSRWVKEIVKVTKLNRQITSGASRRRGGGRGGRGGGGGERERD